MKGLLNLLLTILAIAAVGQSPPVINSFSPLTTYPLDTIVITGSGFSATASDLQVWFGPVKGSIVTSTNNLIQVVVPPEATVANLEVINLNSKRSGKSNKKFAPYFSGNPFDATKFGAPLTFANTAELYDFCSCDFNGDGKPDVASSKFDNAADVLILKNQSTVGALAFAQQTTTIGFPTEQITCGDLNGDGKPDLVASRSGGASGLSGRHTVFYMTNTSASGNISFSAPTSLFLDPTHYARYIFIRDLNIDGKPEIIVSNSNNNEIYVFVNTSSGGNPTFNPTPVRIAVAGASNLYGLDVQDMNGDSKPELIITQFNKNNIYILINESTNLIEFNATPFQQTTSAAFNKIIAADFNEDGKMDIVASNFFGNTVDVWYNSPQVGVIQFTKVSISTSAFPNGLDVGDIDGDKDLDIIVGCRDQLGILLNDGNNAGPTFTRVDIARLNTNRNAYLVDFDSDGKPDIAHVNRSATNQFSISFLNNQNCFKPEILNTAPLSICVGQTIQLKTIPAINANHDWKQGGVSFKSGPDFYADITSSGTFTVTSGACNVVSAPFVVNPDAGTTVPIEPQITSNQPICTGQTLTLSTPAVSGGSYKWTKPDGTNITTQNISITNATVSEAGEYSLVVSVGACRSNQAEKLVGVVNLQNFDIYSPSETNAACQGSSIALTVSDYPNFTYQWMKNGAAESGQTSTTYNASTSGLYKNRVTHATIPGCTVDTRELDVKVLSQPTASFTLPSPACVNMNLNFASTSTSDPLASSILKCDWDFGDATLSGNCTDTHSYGTAQSYTVKLTISYTGVTGCTSQSSQSLSVNNSATPVITPTLTEICPGEETELTVSGGTFSTFVWTPSGTGNPLLVNAGGDYTVTTTDANGCVATANVTITEKPTPLVTVNPEVATVSSGQSLQLTASGADTYVWSPGALLNDSTIADPTATVLSTTVFTLIASTAGQCDVLKTVTITVDGQIKIPNVFTPNGDGDNDRWRIPGYETSTNCWVIIFDRDGSKVIEGDASNLNWNGEYNGKPAPQGTYYYVISCPDSKPVTGNILVAR